MRLPSRNSPCQTCNLTKIHQLPFEDQFKKASQPLDCVPIDLFGLISTPSIAGSRYFLIIVDEATSLKITFMLKRKTEAFDQFVIVKNLMENQQNQRIKKLIFDRGGKFLHEEFKVLS
ncbi:hypothetical protein O181_038759 [Austropuccinia psidii MF-1]|uniref:Integrase catalytic domain-containing protein n=1 Tax=Austropuccinia psidii MF-1 TaxID=1389203 RepID=A0A9Q3HDW0_9BASI|nr:hypothetical protein [Austropuccinia psidii MF-1]